MYAINYRAMMDTFNQIPASFIDECAPRYKTDEEVQQHLDAYLNGCHGTVEVLGRTFWVSQVLKQCDPHAYHEELCHYVSEENQLWVDTAWGWLTVNDVDLIVNAWELTAETEQNKYLNDCGCGGCDDCDDCDCDEEA